MDRPKARIPRTSNLVAFERRRLAAPEGDPATGPDLSWSQKLYLSMSDADRALLEDLPTARQMEDLFASRAFRHVMVRMRAHQNAVADALLTCDPRAVPEIRGRVLGIRQALNVPARVYDDARNRERPEAADDLGAVQASDLEPDDFGQPLGRDLASKDTKE